MRQQRWLTLFFLLSSAPICFAATKDKERPDREMLRMMEFLREMEMIKQLDVMQDLQDVEQVGDQATGTTGQKTPPRQKKETVK